MNKKLKALVGSALAIAMSASIAAGGTFALFTDKAEVNVAITAGKVDVDANISALRLYSMDRYMGDDAVVFENLGTATLTNKTLTLTNITPGDKVEFDIDVTSMSNVKTKMRTSIIDMSADDSLMKGLKIVVDGEELDIVGSAAISSWKTVDPTAGLDEEDKKMTVSIELPAEAGNEYQEKVANLTISLEAVQWNAEVTDPIPGATNVATADALTNALANDSVKVINVMGTIDGDTEILPWDGYDVYTAEYAIKNKDLLDGGEIVLDGAKYMGVMIGDTAKISNTTLSGKNSKSVAYVESATKELTMENVTINAENSNGLWIESTAPGVVLDNVTINQSGIGAGVNSWHESAIEVGVNSNLTINSGYYKSSKYALYALDNASQHTVVTINGGTFVGEIVCGIGNEIIINGGTFSENPALVNGVKINGAVVANEDGTYTVYDSMKTALTLQKKDVVIELSEDTVLDVDARELEGYGGGIIETITINGNGKTLNFNHLNNDWNDVSTNGAKLIINNANITNSGKNNGPWNRHDINFSCEVELNNVTSDKALAFKAGAKLNNVTINDANTSDTYAIWIQPNGQTIEINGLTIDMLACTDGRGIKIDEQYVDAPQKVTLKITDAIFKTEEKSAILVKSMAGADIILSNVDISGVAADSTNAVWVDDASSAYFDLVTVTGATKVQE